MPTLLLEIGTEELPASYIQPAMRQLASMAQTRLQQERITCERIQTWGTPRRLVLWITGLPTAQDPAVRDMRGPSVETAFTASGEPTGAAIGFARSHGISVSELRVKRYETGEFVVAEYRDEGLPIEELLPRILTDLITGLTFPKTMRWGSQTISFARPIRWIVALLDEAIIPFSLGGVDSGRFSRGHRFLAPGELEIPSAGDYRRVMEENHVVVDPAERRNLIKRQLKLIAQQESAEVDDDGSLLDTLTFQVEYPTVLRCTFDESFLSLPDQVLIKVLRYGLFLFPMRNAGGELTPSFLAVRNGDKAYLGTVREGYESVARAKLIDAEYYFDHDRERALADRVEDLRGVVIHDRLGSMYERAGRLQMLASIIADKLGVSPTDRALAERAAWLCKADLTTSMVMEHPELHGAMGRVYARASGEEEVVASAIGQHARPHSPLDSIPTTQIARIVALADKLDVAAGALALGDPSLETEDSLNAYQAAAGIVRILSEANYRLSLSELFTAAYKRIAVEGATAPDAAQAIFMELARNELDAALATAQFPKQVNHAVLAVSTDYPADAIRRARLINDQLSEPAFQEMVHAVVRLQQLARHGIDEPLQHDLRQNSEDTELLARYQEIAPQAKFFAERGEFEALLSQLTSLTTLVSRFLAASDTGSDESEAASRSTLARDVLQLYRRLAELAPLASLTTVIARQ